MSQLAVDDNRLDHIHPNQRKTLFKPGQSGNPAGKPKGVKNKLSECFINDLYDSWKRRGMQALDQMAQDKPGEYVRAIASIMPKDVMVTMADQGNTYVINASPMSAEQWAEKHGVQLNTIEHDTE